MNAIAVVLLLAASQPRELDVKRSELVVKTAAAGIGKGFAHNHVVKATDFSGKVQLEPLEVSVTVKVASLSVDDPEVRKRHGETKPMKESDRQAVTEAMLGEKQLDAKRYPTITFRSTKAAKDGEKVVLTGELTLHGVTRTVQVPVKLEGETGEGRFTIRTSDFGIKPYSAALGAIKNRDEVDFVIRLVAAK